LDGVFLTSRRQQQLFDFLTAFVEPPGHEREADDPGNKKAY
jgi:hypothetical protein